MGSHLHVGLMIAAAATSTARIARGISRISMRDLGVQLGVLALGCLGFALRLGLGLENSSSGSG